MQGFFGGGAGGAVQFIERRDSVTRVAEVDGQSAFFLPFGVFVRESDISLVTVNGAPVAFGLGRSSMLRQRAAGGWPQPSTDDCRSGIWLDSGAAAGDVVVIEFVTRELLGVAPPAIGMLVQDGGFVPNPGPPGSRIRFNYQSGAGKVPAQFRVREIEGLQVEFWRWSRHYATARTTSLGLVQQRHGKHFEPWYRTPEATASGDRIIDPRIDGWVKGPPTPSSRYNSRFKAAFYDPATGARTKLGDQLLRATGNDERTAAGLAHSAHAIWTTA